MVAHEVGIEPTTSRLTVDGSAAELLVNARDDPFPLKRELRERASNPQSSD